jgi:mono/diheme cytochrome c family protein
MPKRLASHDRKNASLRNGKALFTEKGCIGCHSNQRKVACLSDRVPNLADAGLKLYRRWIVTWLEAPSTLNLQTPMPRLMLTDEERRDLTAYIKSLSVREVNELLKATPKKVLEGGIPEEGKRLVQVMGCYGCHRVQEMDQLALPGVKVAEVANKRLEEFPFGASQVPRTKWDWLFYKIKQPDLFKTEDMPLRMPDYRLSESEIEMLTIFYLHNDYYNIPEHYLSESTPETKTLTKGEWMLDHYNCNGCHQIKEKSEPRIARYLALKSMNPPWLIGEAERVQPQWFFQYLSRPVELRPWLKIRMPEFKWTYQDRKDLIDYFALMLDQRIRQAAAVPYVLLPIREDYDPEILAMGEYRIKTDKCMQCHPVSLDDALPEGVKLEDLSINLMLAKARLRFEWIKNFLRNPDRYAGKGTKMPFVYYTPDKVPRIPNPEMWIQYSALYLMFMDKVPEMPEEKKIEEIRPGSEIDWTQYE